MDLSDTNILKNKEDLIDRVREVTGHEPMGLRVLLRTLSHPDILPDAIRYFTGLDTSGQCKEYEPPWSCAKESEARYENIIYGWLGGTSGVGLDNSWCENCRKRALGENH